MPRLPRPLDATAGPVQAFAAELRQLRDRAGNPKYLQMARTSGRSRTALAEAAGGDHLPTWETVAAFVTACKSDTATWRSKWEHVRDQMRDNGNGADESYSEQVAKAGSEAAAQPAPGSHQSPLRSRLLSYIATVTATALVTVSATILITGSSSDRNHDLQPANAINPTPAVTAAVITVQNKVARGTDRLIEDSTPVYLSAKTTPYCARDGCKLSGTEMASGVMLVAVCHIAGTEMFNYNLGSSESENNPHRVRSTLWYRVALHDGRTGYISEVYLAPEDRGGKGLPMC